MGSVIDGSHLGRALAASEGTLGRVVAAHRRGALAGDGGPGPVVAGRREPCRGAGVWVVGEAEERRSDSRRGPEGGGGFEGCHDPGVIPSGADAGHGRGEGFGLDAGHHRSTCTMRRSTPSTTVERQTRHWPLVHSRTVRSHQPWQTTIRWW